MQINGIMEKYSINPKKQEMGNEDEMQKTKSKMADLNLIILIIKCKLSKHYDYKTNIIITD